MSFYNDFYNDEVKANFEKNASNWHTGDNAADRYSKVNAVYDDNEEFDCTYDSRCYDEFEEVDESNEADIGEVEISKINEPEIDETDEAKIDEADEAEISESDGTEIVETYEAENNESSETDVAGNDDVEAARDDFYVQVNADAKKHYEQMDIKEIRKVLTTYTGELDPTKQKEAAEAKKEMANKYKRKKIDLFFLEDLFLSNYAMTFICGRYYIYNGKTYELLTEYRFQLYSKELMKDLGDVRLMRMGFLKDAYAFTLVQRKDKNEIMYRMRKYQTYIVFDNCVVNAETMESEGHSKEISVPGCIHASYIECEYEDIKTPNMDRLLYTMTAGDEDVIELIWDIMGYCVLYNAPIMRVFFWFGTRSGSGKSVLGSVLRDILGEEQVSSIEANKLGDKHGAAGLIDSPINIAMECSGELSKKAVTKIKTITGDRIFDAEKKYENSQEIFNRSKLIFGSNEEISLVNMKNAEAVWDRVIPVPCVGSCPKEERVANFDLVILQERDEIATKAAWHANKLIQNNFRFDVPDASIKIKEDWMKNSMTEFERFCAECIEKCDNHHFVATQELLETYQDYSGDDKMTIIQFGRRFKNQFPTLVKERKECPDIGKAYGYYGIGIRLK